MNLRCLQSILVAQQRNFKPPCSMLWKCCWCFPGLVFSPSEDSVYGDKWAEAKLVTLSPCVHGCRTVLAPTGTKKFQFGGKTSADTSLSSVVESHPPKEHQSSKGEIPAPCAWRKLSLFTKPTKMSSSKDKTTSKPAEVLAAKRHFFFS